ncbi:MAG: Gfo/Idh/MocA family oxidoreductase [Frankia sp.]|nr:Gfo/Idh/MocA family oxidoreductase [Frankia sp.]
MTEPAVPAQPVPSSATPIRWGVAGTGTIAQRFARDLAHVPDARLVAVGSRSAASAAAFAAEFAVPHQHSSYEALAEDPDVDIVYVASPHTAHHPHTLLFLSAGKHVLCEKPLAVNARQAAEMVAAAERAGRFLMEAVWSRFVPGYQALREVVAAGEIGEVRLVQAEFGFRAPFDPQHRLFDPGRAGGSVLDIGIYPVQLAHLLLGTPDEVTASAVVGRTGVDEHATAVLRYDWGDGALAIATSSLRVDLPGMARVIGTNGSVEFPAEMWAPTSVVVRVAGGDERRLATPLTGSGLHYQVGHVHGRLRGGHLDSDVMPLAESVRIAETLDRVRAAIGVRYPADDLAGQPG